MRQTPVTKSGYCEFAVQVLYVSQDSEERDYESPPTEE